MASNSKDEKNKKYLILDSGNVPLAHAELLSPDRAEELYLRILDDGISTVMQHELIELVGIFPGTPSLLGRIIRNKDDVIILKKQHTLGEDVRENLRIPTNFDTFIFPVTGSWKGRKKVISYDLSCRGVAFFSDTPLQKGERLEFLIPITQQPLILSCEILRERETPQKKMLYSGKFVNMCRDEENMVCEAVFAVQLKQRGFSSSDTPKSYINTGKND